MGLGVDRSLRLGRAGVIVAPSHGLKSHVKSPSETHALEGLFAASTVRKGL
jgi:hypothetical protein